MDEWFRAPEVPLAFKSSSLQLVLPKRTFLGVTVWPHFLLTVTYTCTCLPSSLSWQTKGVEDFSQIFLPLLAGMSYSSSQSTC